MNPVVGVLIWLINVYLIILIARLVIDWIQVFARDWRPRGPLAVVCEGVFTATDPPLRALRKVMPPVRLGSVSLDLSFIVLMIGLSLLISLLRQVG